METYELRYFLAAAARENLGQAARDVSVSVPAISRAISRLEEELGTELFQRVGRNIRLSPNGKKLQREASRVVGMIDDVRARFKPSGRAVPITVCGTEFGISLFLPGIVKRLRALGIEPTLDVRVLADSRSVERALLDGESRLGIVTAASKTSEASALARLSLGRFESRTLAGPGHPLHKATRAGKSVPIEKVLEFEFVSLSSQSELQDGWRDDRFKRRIGARTESISAALRLIEAGEYLGYLPHELAKGTGISPVPTRGCPYSCVTGCQLLGKDPEEYSWMSRLFRTASAAGSRSPARRGVS